MLRIVTSTVLAATVALGSATVVSAMQGARTGNPPGVERPLPASAATSEPMAQGAGMMGQTGDAMMGNPQMKGQMGKTMEDCPCCQRMGEMERERQKRR